jgi:N-acetylglucosamine-6-phosphate deacetylase
MRQAFTSDRIFDGQAFHTGALIVEDGIVVDVGAEAADATHLGPGIIAPGFVDLQVNGGDGVMLDASPATLQRIAMAHARLGSTSIFPTLITDTPRMTRAVVDMVATAKVPGTAGLHLEGPHLSIARRGAHDAAQIRPMTDDDLQFLIHAATRLPRLMVTIAPENVTLDQVKALTAAGIIVSLGHTDCTYATALAYIAAGARVATHLFNAMSQLGNREPGLVGAVLTQDIAAGIIADGLHVHPANLTLASQADIFLVTDAMACAGTDMTSFSLNGRTIHRAHGRLTLDDGTLAGADLDMATAIRTMHAEGLAELDALAMATSIPARVAGIGAGRLTPGAPADFVHLSPDLTLQGTWRNAAPVA